MAERIASIDHQVRNKRPAYQYVTDILSKSPTSLSLKRTVFYSMLEENLIPDGPKTINLIKWIHSQGGGIPITYQCSLPNPNTFQPYNDNTNNGTIEAVLYWKGLSYNLQPPKVLMHQHFCCFLDYKIQLLNYKKHNLWYCHNHILGYIDHCRRYTLTWTMYKLLWNLAMGLT